MSRYFYLGILVLGILGIVISFLYKTPSVELAATGYFGGVSLRLEYAMTPEARERGLGGRTEILENYGMLFVFAEDDIYGFWMKDMLVPIDIFWLNAQGQVVSIAANVAPSTYPNVLLSISTGAVCP